MLLNKDVMHILILGQEHNFNHEVHVLACFIIDELVVENGMYSRQLFDLFNQSSISEVAQLENGDIILNLIHNETKEEQGMHLDERLGSIMLSGPQLIEVPDGSQWVTIGSKYIDGVFYP